MDTVIFAPVTFNLAETTRMIEVARALTRLGPVRAVFQGYEPEFVPLITGAGFDHRPCEPVLSPAQRRLALAFDQGRTLRHPFGVDLVRRRVRAERALIRAEGASAVVTGTNLTSMVSARAEGVPLFYPVPFALTRPHVEQTAGALLRLLYTRAPVAPRSFAVARRENGVPPDRTVAGLLEADHNLLTVLADEVDGFRLPPAYRRVGPVFARLPGELPEQVLELAARDRPLVYLALGSSGGRRLVLRAARALAGAPVNVVAPVRHFLRPGDVLPGNVTVTGLLPAHLLGGVVDAAVLHGGQGTVQTACATGVPFVGMGLQPEQTWNVRVCARRGNAVALSPRQVGTPEFVAAVRRVLTDPAVRAAAHQVRRLHAEEDGASACAQHILAVLGRR